MNGFQNSDCILVIPTIVCATLAGYQSDRRPILKVEETTVSTDPSPLLDAVSYGEENESPSTSTPPNGPDPMDVLADDDLFLLGSWNQGLKTAIPGSLVRNFVQLTVERLRRSPACHRKVLPCTR